MSSSSTSSTFTAGPSGTLIDTHTIYKHSSEFPDGVREEGGGGTCIRITVKGINVFVQGSKGSLFECNIPAATVDIRIYITESIYIYSCEAMRKPTAEDS